MSSVSESSPILHGPQVTARFGRVLAVDMAAPQINMVVERGSELPRASVIVTNSARRMMELSKAGEKLDHVVVIGTGQDPSSHPHLREITENVRALRDKWFNRAKLAVVTQVTDLESYELRAALSMYDKLITRFEWGTAKTFASATGEKSTALANLTRQLGGFDHVIVQANFFRGDVDNSTVTEVTGWIKRLRDVGPQEVHMIEGPGDTPLQSKKSLRAIPKGRFQKIADEVSEKTGLNVAVHPAESLLAS